MASERTLNRLNARACREVEEFLYGSDRCSVSTETEWKWWQRDLDDGDSHVTMEARYRSGHSEW